MLVKDLMNRKVITVSEDTSIVEAASLMADNHVGSLVVVLHKKIRGILTERDIMIGLAQLGEDLPAASVRDIMTNYVYTITPQAGALKGIRLMADNNIKKLPVVDGDLLVGIITVTDIILNYPKLAPKVSRLFRARD